MLMRLLFYVLLIVLVPADWAAAQRADGLTDQQVATRDRDARDCRLKNKQRQTNERDGHFPGLYIASANLPRVAWDSRLAACAATDYRTIGANIVVPWSSVETAPGEFDWSYVLAEVEPWVARGQKVNLLFWGSAQRKFQEIDGVPATPSWVLSVAPTITCEKKDENGNLFVDDHEVSVPVHYDLRYRDPYLVAVEQFIRRFENEPWVNYMRIGIGVGAESYPANRATASDGECRDDWEVAGFTTDKWREHALFMVDRLGEIAPKKAFVVTINQIGGDPDFPDILARKAVEEYGFGVGTQGATARAIEQYASNPNGGRCYANWCNIFERYKDSGVVLEIQTPSNSNPAGLTREWAGRTGPLPPILEFAIDRGATSIELYPSEWAIANAPDGRMRRFARDYDKALSRAASRLNGNR